jgi:hypothetical protein
MNPISHFPTLKSLLLRGRGRILAVRRPAQSTVTTVSRNQQDTSLSIFP